MAKSHISCLQNYSSLIPEHLLKKKRNLKADVFNFFSVKEISKEVQTNLSVINVTVKKKLKFAASLFSLCKSFHTPKLTEFGKLDKGSSSLC